MIWRNLLWILSFLALGLLYAIFRVWMWDDILKKIREGPESTYALRMAFSIALLVLALAVIAAAILWL